MDASNITLTDEQKDRIGREIEDYGRDYQAFEDAYPDLVSRHEGRWVAWTHGETVYADSLVAVLKAASEQGWDLGRVIARKLLRERPAVLL
jgi:hypothetical protein